MENKTLRRTIGRSASKATEEYGDVVSVIKVVWDIAKHVVIEKLLRRKRNSTRTCLTLLLAYR